MDSRNSCLAKFPLGIMGDMYKESIEAQSQRKTKVRGFCFLTTKKSLMVYILKLLFIMYLTIFNHAVYSSHFFFQHGSFI